MSDVAIPSKPRVAPTTKDRLRAVVGSSAVQRAASALRFDLGYWQRHTSYEQCDAWVHELGPSQLDVAEISGTEHWKQFPFRSYVDRQYPEFDICSQPLDAETLDLVIADQVFEHLAWPYRAARNIYQGLRPGGHVLILVPFLIRIHREPLDCTRWSEEGLRYFLAEVGFELGSMRSGSWGNRACVKANLNMHFWPRRGWGSGSNEKHFPVNVWTLAKKT